MASQPGTLALALLIACVPAGVSAQEVTVTVEEEVYTLTPPGNGAGPLWSYGNTVIARIADEVYVAQMETGEGVPLLCNTRWRILRRDDGEWVPLAEASGYRQREPAVFAVTGEATLNLYVNDSLRPPGEQYQACDPKVLRFDTKQPVVSMSVMQPVWNEATTFTDHSYRGFAADREARQVLMFNIDAKTSKQHYALIDDYGVTLANGALEFPIRGAYPQAALRGNAAHVVAVGDIVEPNEEWRAFKAEQTGRAWDYVFRRLFYATARDIAQGFSIPLEIANVDATAGHITNHDLWIAPNGDAYILYAERDTLSSHIRDRYFPESALVPSLKLAIVRDGEIAERRVFVEGTPGMQPGTARFHETIDGALYVLMHIGGSDSQNQLRPVLSDGPPIRVPFTSPFTSFTLASVRAGNRPSNRIDVVGHQSSGAVMAYGQVNIEY